MRLMTVRIFNFKYFEIDNQGAIHKEIPQNSTNFTPPSLLYFGPDIKISASIRQNPPSCGATSFLDVNSHLFQRQ